MLELPWLPFTLSRSFPKRCLRQMLDVQLFPQPPPPQGPFKNLSPYSFTQNHISLTSAPCHSAAGKLSSPFCDRLHLHLSGKDGSEDANGWPFDALGFPIISGWARAKSFCKLHQERTGFGRELRGWAKFETICISSPCFTAHLRRLAKSERDDSESKLEGLTSAKARDGDDARTPQCCKRMNHRAT